MTRQDGSFSPEGGDDLLQSELFEAVDEGTSAGLGGVAAAPTLRRDLPPSPLRIRVQLGKRLEILIEPLAQQQALGKELRHRAIVLREVFMRRCSPSASRPKMAASKSVTAD